MKEYIKYGFGIIIGVSLGKTAIELLQIVVDGITEGITESKVEDKGSE